MPGPFHLSAHVYDVVYSHLDYPASAEYVEGLIRERNPEASSLLDVACGTGLHLGVWRHHFDHVVGVDLDPNMLAVARERLPGIELHEGDFTSFDLARTFDAVTCMFSSIGYANTPEQLDVAIGAFARHLVPGGVMVVEPWFRKSAIQPHVIRGLIVEGDDVVVARTSRWVEVGDDQSDLEFALLVTTTQGTEHLTERHVMGLYEPERYVEAAVKAGLEAEFLPDGSPLGRGMLVAVR